MFVFSSLLLTKKQGNINIYLHKNETFYVKPQNLYGFSRFMYVKMG